MTTSRGTVLVTGGGSGIGLACTKFLAQAGYHVLAGVIDDAEGAELANLERVTAAPLDVTNPAQIEAALHGVAGDLSAVINNAGIVVAGPLEYLSADDLRKQFDVNVLGLMAVTRAALPLLRASRGRVVNMGSVGGRLAVPFTGAYSASKFAVRALSDALRAELLPSGVHVALIEPGPIQTPIWQRSLAAAERRVESFPPEALEHYANAIAGMTAMTQKTAAGAIPVERVVMAVEHAIMSDRPRAQYLVGAFAHVQSWVSHLPVRVRDRLLLRAMGLGGNHSA